MRTLGSTDILVSSVAMGCWPISGMTSLDVNDDDSLKTLRAAVDAGINFFDTAYCYGRDGESEKLIARAFANERDSIVIATKGGIHWEADGSRILDASAATLRRECEASLQRLGTDFIDLLYLHAPDPGTPLEVSAAELRSLMDAGMARCIGVSNFDREQLETFHKICPVSVVQPPYNMLQRQIERDLIPWCQEHQVSVVVYWPLLKGLLAGKLDRNHVFQPGDGRAKYPMFQGEQWLKNQDLVDELRVIANGLGQTVAQLVVAWTISRPGITSALCGAKRDAQIRETARAMSLALDDDTAAQIDQALQRRGAPITQAAV